MNAPDKGVKDFHVADMALADWGRKEILIAETEMPGLMAIREEFAPGKPLRGAIFGAQGHQARHLGLGDVDLLAPPLGEAHVLDFVIGGRHSGLLRGYPKSPPPSISRAPVPQGMQMHVPSLKSLADSM